MKHNSMSHTVEVIRNKLGVMIGNLNRLRAAFWGVQLEGMQRFYGACHFRKYPGTAISIGRACSFRSRSNSNLIGINRPCMISTLHSDFNAEIRIGHHCGFSGTVIGAFRSIVIGNHVRCGANTLITDSDWHLDDPRSGTPQQVVIGDNVWLGVNSVVLKGVTIGENTVIGANSVVTKSIPANVVAAGNPCKVIRSLEQKILVPMNA